MTDREFFLLNVAVYMAARMVVSSARHADGSIPTEEAALIVDTALTAATAFLEIEPAEMDKHLEIAIDVFIATERLANEVEPEENGLKGAIDALMKEVSRRRPDIFSEFIDGLDL